MRRCTRYAYFPRIDLDRGDILFPDPGDSSSPLSAILQYTTLLHQYLHVTLLQFASLRANLTLAEMTRASGAGTSRRPRRLRTFTHSSLEQIRRGIARFSPSPTPTIPSRTRSSAAHYYSRFTPVRSQRRRSRADPPSYSGDSRDDRASPGYCRTEEAIDTTTLATPLEMEF